MRREAGNAVIDLVMWGGGRAPRELSGAAVSTPDNGATLWLPEDSEKMQQRSGFSGLTRRIQRGTPEGDA